MINDFKVDMEINLEQYLQGVEIKDFLFFSKELEVMQNAAKINKKYNYNHKLFFSIILPTSKRKINFAFQDDWNTIKVQFMRIFNQ